MNNYSDSTLYINLDAIRYNYAFFKSISKETEVGCVVKANCYGLGVGKIAPIFENKGCCKFFVATLNEALELKNIISHKSEVYVFHGIKKNELHEFSANNIIPVLNDIHQLEIYSQHAVNLGKKLPCVIHFDTGMNRLGVDYQDAERVRDSAYIKDLDVKFLMSHFACVSERGHELNGLQYERMKKIKQIFPECKISLSNSRGAISSENYHFDLIRPGSGLYGICAGIQKEISHVITLKSKIIQIRDIKEDSYVGYGATAKVKKGSRLAIVPVGYADGYFRGLSNKSYAYFNGYKLPLLGIVSMDLTIFDISSVPSHQLNVGDELELIGENVWLHELSQASSTIGYEILTRLGNRYKRVYVG